MDRRYILGVIAVLACSPIAVGHDPGGLPKNHCEDPSEWRTHDYGPPATGLLVAFGQDGNLAGDCDGDTTPADYDGHLDFALGGAWLSAYTGDGVSSGSLVCYGEVGHHGAGPITVDDLVFGSFVPFIVTADTVNANPPTDPSEPDCGDFESDEGTWCVGACSVTFTAGIDGAYVVHVGDTLDAFPGSEGHVVGEGGGSGPPPAIRCDRPGGVDLVLEVEGAPGAWAEATLYCDGLDQGNCRATVPQGKTIETCVVGPVTSPGVLTCKITARGLAPPRTADRIKSCG